MGGLHRQKQLPAVAGAGIGTSGDAVGRSVGELASLSACELVSLSACELVSLWPSCDDCRHKFLGARNVEQNVAMKARLVRQ